MSWSESGSPLRGDSDSTGKYGVWFSCLPTIDDAQCSFILLSNTIGQWVLNNAGIMIEKHPELHLSIPPSDGGEV